VKFAVGILTRNAISTLRWHLLERTGESLCLAFPDTIPVVLDNGSDDGSELMEQALHFSCQRPRHVPEDGNTSPGRGRNVLMRVLNVMCPFQSEIVVLSDDDVEWHQGAAEVLTRFWEQAPDDVVLLSCLLEPDWPWNTPREVIECGGVKALVRDSAPAAAWTFRIRDWDKIGPLTEGVTGEGEDFEACARLRSHGYRVAQIALATHIGEGYSQLGNDEARSLAGRPLDREKWKL